ncbi:MAG: hypothetical protein CBB68_07760 [Rhodospirillaceae bacterium TMED8]|nr:exopolyphosphatase [Magnetovibrio sp.]OUT50875.1 MAG: hypothetical protein CBB68_07760 [Rhodospirillaceae bacterium TMED8]
MIGETSATWMADLSETGLGRVGVVDIGSNSIRLVVYDAPTRLPIPIFNEKTECGLVRGMAKTGRLHPEGVSRALRSLWRFHLLTQSMGIERIALVATAAVREALDGTEFAQQVGQIFGIPVRVISGNEEARLSAVGLLSGYTKADGLIADLGGGSCDFMELNEGSFGLSGSVPLGHVRLKEAAKGSTRNSKMIVAKYLATVPWLTGVENRTLFLAGGSWRALARVFIHDLNYPLHVIDGFTLRTGEANSLSSVIASCGAKINADVLGISMSRYSTLPYSAAVLLGLLHACNPKSIVFAGFGMREGQMLEMLPPRVRSQDPLLAGCARMAERMGRFAITGEEIFDWMSPIFPSTRDDVSRIRMAACILSDIGWSEHPDYRAEHAFLRVLRIPFAGLTHHNRVLLAVIIFVRYKGNAANSVVHPVRSLLSDSDISIAESVGYALRIAHKLSGSAPDLLSTTKFIVDSHSIELVLPKNNMGGGNIFVSEAVKSPLCALASSLNKSLRLS